VRWAQLLKGLDITEAFKTFLKVVGNLIPSEKPREVFAILQHGS
jgi:hypothetical protein